MRKTLGEWCESTSEKAFRDSLNKLMKEKCPEVGYACEGSCGVVIKDFRSAMEKLMLVPFWRDKFNFEGDNYHPLFRVSADGTQRGEMFSQSVEVVGVSCMNLPKELHQNVNFYIPLAAVPMVESKGSMERFLSALYTSIDQCKSILVPTSNGASIITHTLHNCIPTDHLWLCFLRF